jgi:hypothetical protein
MSGTHRRKGDETHGHSDRDDLRHAEEGHGHDAHGHTHGLVDPSVSSND